VALGIAGIETARPDAMTFALLVATPARRLSWNGRVLSNASE
jgi:hypothetical protein